MKTKKDNYIYPSHYDDCTLEDWNACLGCRNWDNCERKEQFRKFDRSTWAIIIIGAILVNMLIAYLIGVL